MGKRKKRKKQKEQIFEENRNFKKIKAVFIGPRIIADKSDETNELYDKSRFGERVEDKHQYSLVEGLYLLEKKRVNVKDNKGRIFKFEDYMNKAQKIEKNFFVRYVVFKDLRSRGYIVKTALKFGADFRVYDRGIKPGEDHAKWVVFPVHENEALIWREFAAKNRVAHSTRKKLLLAVVDEEGDCSYWESGWVKP